MARLTEYLNRDAAPSHPRTIPQDNPLPLANPIEPPEGHGVNSVCTFCGGNGWRYVEGNVRAVVRCVCRGGVQFQRLAPVKDDESRPPDGKLAAVGERDDA